MTNETKIVDGGVNLPRSGKVTIGGDVVGGSKISADGSGSREAGSDAGDAIRKLVQAKIDAALRETETENRIHESIADKVENMQTDNLTNTSGGISGGTFGNVGGNVTGGDVTAGGDINTGNTTTTNTSTTGLTAEDVAKLFDSIYKKIESKPKEDQPAIKDAVDTIKAAAQAEAVQGEPPNEKEVTAAAKSLALDAPDLLTDAADVALATLANPAVGVITLIRKIAEKVKASRGG